MNRTRITQQTSTTTLRLRGELAHDAPSPKALRSGTFHSPLQWALEGPGWGVLRVVVALGGVNGALGVPAVDAPLLAVPPLVLLLFYLRGLYRTRLRVMVLDGVVPVVRDR